MRLAYPAYMLLVHVETLNSVGGQIHSVERAWWHPITLTSSATVQPSLLIPVSDSDGKGKLKGTHQY